MAMNYSRHDNSDPLEHHVRADVYGTIEASPGTYLTEVSEEVSVPLSTVRHHIRVLEREGLVSEMKVRGKRRFYSTEWDEVELTAALSDQATASVLEMLARLDSATVGKIASELDRDPSTISYHLKRLSEDGLVERERDGRTIVNRLDPTVEAAVSEMAEDELPDATLDEST